MAYETTGINEFKDQGLKQAFKSWLLLHLSALIFSLLNSFPGMFSHMVAPSNFTPILKKKKSTNLLFAF